MGFVWLKDNLDYSAFGVLCVVCFGLKYMRTRRLGWRGLPLLEWGFALLILVGGWFFMEGFVDHERSYAEFFLGHKGTGYWAAEWARLLGIGLVACVELVFGTVASNLAAMRRYVVENSVTFEALKRSEQRLLLHVRRTPMAVIEWDLDFVVTAWNPAAERIFGYSAEEVIGKGAMALIVPEVGRSEMQKVTTELLSTGVGKQCTTVNITKDGRTIICDWLHTPLVDGRGQVIGVTSLCLDVTAKQRAEQEIEKLAAFPRFNPNSVMQFSADGTLEYFNDAAEQLATALGKTGVKEILPDECGKIVRNCMATGQKRINYETELGGRTVSWSFFPVAAIGSVHCYAADITERLNLERELRHSQKMQSVGQLAAGIAHDFNNILTVIQGHSELLRMNEHLTALGKDSLRQIATSAERAARLTQQLLTFGRRQFMQVEVLDLNALIRHFTEMLRRVLGTNIELRISSLEPGLPPIEADLTMMEQIIMNLSVNARDAMPNGGPLVIETRLIHVSRDYVARNPEAAVGDFVCLSVRDEGIGIEPDKLTRLFEPFFTTKEVGKGTGLGLATVYGIVKQHSGWVEVESQVGKGTTFRIFLPASSKQVADASSSEESDVQPVRGGKETVLLVEDEPTVLNLARGILSSYGYKVLEAESGVEALRLWEEHEAIDLLLTDIVMPEGMSGIDLATRLRAEKPGLKVVYTSGYSADVAGRDFGLLEGMTFLQKPYHPQALAQKVRETLDVR